MLKKYVVLMTVIMPIAIAANLHDKEYYVERLELIKERLLFCDPSSVRAIDRTLNDIEQNACNARSLERSAGTLLSIAKKFQNRD
jgi:hypothetical protein